MKLTTPKSILIGLTLIALSIFFRMDETFIQNVKADVAGMNYRELSHDYDFKQAVESIIENCDVSGYVDDYEDFYGGEIIC